MNRSNYIYEKLNEMFPDARCQLDHENPFQLTVAVVLSAQTTDVSVNKVTKRLFEKYPDAQSLASADVHDVEDIIKQIGLYRNKSRSIINLSKMLVEKHDGQVPDSLQELTELPGVGRKCANVILAECFDQQRIAVDTHVQRIARRLKIADDRDSVLEVENKMMAYFDESLYRRIHHLFIFFGRYKCKAARPDCQDCPFSQFCTYKKNQ